MSLMTTSANDISQTREFLETENNLRHRNLKIGFLLTLFFVPAGNCLEWFVYRDYIVEFLTTRLVFDVFQLPLFALLFLPIGERQVKVLSHIWPLIPVIMVSWLIYRSEGSVSPYYAGLNLMIIVACFLIPFTWLEALFYCTMTLLTYVIACVAHDQTDVNWMLLLNNLYFISVTGVICVVACYFLTRKRQEDFRLRHELAQRNEQLAELDRLKSDFFANISHELRTPLTLILAPIDEMLGAGSNLSISARNSIAMVRSNAMRLLSLINDLLDLVRLEGGTLKLDCKPLNVTNLVRGLVESTRHLAERKQQKIELNDDYTPVIVNADSNRLEKIILNLLTNAIKFTDKNGTITVKWHLESENYVLSVKDDGIGIAEEDLSNIFDRFKQVDSSSTRKYQGLGLGLAMARELALEHNGTLEAKSKLGEGSEFILKLPQISDPNLAVQLEDDEDSDPIESLMHEAESHQSSSPITPETGIVGDGKFKVVVIDDEPDMRSFLTTTLANEHEVHFASDGISGLKMIQSIKPDLAILDLMMPGMNGMDVCSAIRQSQDLQLTRVILVTARADEHSKIECLNRGADDYLTKPFSTIELHTRVKNLLKANQLQKELKKSYDNLSETLKKLQETESQLLQSEKMNALGSLAAGLLHEINNPLNFTQFAVQILQKKATSLTDLESDTLKDISEGIERVAQIISDLRDFAYPEQSGNHAVFNVKESITSALRFTSNICSEINVETDVSDMLINGSKSQLTQVLVNLIQNAVNALESSQHSPCIWISGHVAEQKAHIILRDNGSGIDEGKLKRVFEPFFTTRDVGQGMGLGLSICHTIITNMGGQIQIESKTGTGTTVYIEIPQA